MTGAPPTTEQALATYAAVVAKVDDFWQRAVTLQPRAFVCAEKCADCCGHRLSVAPVEAAVIRDWILRLDPALQRRVAQQATEPGPCPLLVDARCAIYPVRPILCRSHGLALRVDDRIDHCPLNFTEEEPTAAGILEVERINTLLVLVDLQYRQATGLDPEDPRIPLATLALGVGH